MRANPAFVRGIAGNAFSCLCIASQNLGELCARVGLGWGWGYDLGEGALCCTSPRQGRTLRAALC